MGEVVLRGPSLCDGYEGDPEAGAARFTPDGLRTGDLGYLAGGELFITGRCKDLIILHGHNYDPQDLERAVGQVAGVRDEGRVVAFSRPGPESEELVIVCEAAAGRAGELPGAIRAHLAAALGVRVAAVHVVAPGALPRTTSGKPRRAVVRDLHLAGRLDTLVEGAA